jgi:hypothetical protein
MAYTKKPGGWQNSRAGGTRLNDDGLNDWEDRIEDGFLAAPDMAPATSARNVIQPSAATATPLTISAHASQDPTADVLTVEHPDSTGLRVGRGGLNASPEGISGVPMMLVVKGDDQGTSQASGVIGAKSHDDAHELVMVASTLESGGAGPHLVLDVAKGLPQAGELGADYWYTEVVHKRDTLHKHAQGVESFAGGDEHFFLGPIHTDDGMGGLTYSHTFITDIATGRTIFNPDVGALPATYSTLVDIRSDEAALPVLRLTGDASQTADLAEFYQGATKKSGVNKGGAFVSDTAAAGIVLKDTQGTPHFWRVTVSNAGALVITDLGTTRPTT